MLALFSEEFLISYENHMCCLSVFSMLGLFVFLVLFTAGGNFKIQLKHFRVVQNQGFQQMTKKMFKVRFGVDLGVSFSIIFEKNATLL